MTRRERLEAEYMVALMRCDAKVLRRRAQVDDARFVAGGPDPGHVVIDNHQAHGYGGLDEYRVAL